MSYDLRIAVKVKGSNLYAVIAEPELNHPTYNLGQMFRACTGWDFDQGKFYKVSDVYENIQHGIYELTHNEEKYLSLNPSNGWGNTTSALNALTSLRECIDGIEDPNNWIGGWNTIPKKFLYVAW